MKRTLLSLLVLGMFMCAPLPLFAQITDEAAEPEDLVATDVAVTLIPAHPKPFDTVTVALSSPTTKLDASEIIWMEGGKEIIRGVGRKTYLTTAKGFGVKTPIDITIVLYNKEVIRKSVTIMPMTIDLLWEATDSIVPPLYRGKALPASQAKLKFVAIPQVVESNGKMAKQSELVYSWQRNYTTRPEAGGYGKNFMNITTTYLHPTETVSTIAETRSGGSVIDTNTKVTTGLPKILWYRVSPLYGPLFDHALRDGYQVTGNSTSVIAEPYFFSPKDPAAESLTYEWTLNGQTIDTPLIPTTVFLQRNNSASGRANLQVSITSANHLFQAMRKTLSLSLE